MAETHLPITFGLVEPSEPGNVGAAARSLGAFGFGHLVLIDPRRTVAAQDRTLAVKTGREVLHNVRVWSAAEFEQKAAPFDEVWGTSARTGRRRRPQDVRTVVTDYLAHEPKRILLLFGPERDGLSLAWLDRCHRLLRLPTAEGAPLNLAHAVTVCAYEFRLQAQTAQAPGADREPSPRAERDPRGPIADGRPTGRVPGDALEVSLRDRQELLRRTEAVLSAMDYPSRALHGHPPSAYLQPLRAGSFSQGQARWLLGLITRLERRLGLAQEAGESSPEGDACAADPNRRGWCAQ